ncbi:MAG: choice-of-anchor J domain-containing protein [Bacteroidales bacterium]|nr:choice-of-anchor J domain-containing protein [Bacteroidales bacterium]
MKKIYFFLIVFISFFISDDCFSQKNEPLLFKDGSNFIYKSKQSLPSKSVLQIGFDALLQKYPIYPYYNYSFSQSIFLQSELGVSDTITKISFFFAGSSLSNSNNWDIYIGHSAKYEFENSTDWIDVNTLTQVYTGTFESPTGPGWIEFDIDDFVYNGVDNLVIAVDENAENYNTTSDKFYSSGSQKKRSIVKFSDTQNIDPLNPGTAVEFDAFVPNIRVFFGYPPMHDLGIVDISPKLVVSGDSVFPQITISNFAQSYEDLWTLSLSDGGAYFYSISNVDTVFAYNSFVVDFPKWQPADGTYSLTAILSVANDQNLQNDTLSQIVQVANSVIMQDGSSFTCSSLFFDSGGNSLNYSTYEDYTYTFFPANNFARLQVKFLNYQIEGIPYDYLIVYDGIDTSSEILATIGNDHDVNLIKSTNTDGALTFKFISDGSFEFDGWQAYISCFYPPLHDMAVVDIQPEFVNLGDSVRPIVTLKNFSYKYENSFDLWFTNTDGTYTGTVTFNRYVEGGDTITVRLPNYSNNEGVDNLTIAVKLADDEVSSNDTLTKSVKFTVISNAYAWNTTSNNFSQGAVTLQLPTGYLSQISNYQDGYITAADMVGYEWYGIYVADGQQTQLVKIDKNTGELTFIGQTIDNLTGFAYDAYNHIAYTINFNGDLYSIDLGTAQTNFIGGNFLYPIGLACDSLGSIYAISLNNQLATLNYTSGIATVIGDLGIDLSYSQDIAFDRDQNKLYGTLYCNDSGSGLYSIDVTTAQTILIQELPDKFAGFAIPYSPKGANVLFSVADTLKPIKNASIKIGNYTLYTDEFGLDSIFLEPEIYNYQVTAYGYDTVYNSLQINHLNDTLVNVVLTELQQYTTIFTITDAFENLIPDAKITLFFEQNPVKTGKTDQFGVFVADSLYHFEYIYVIEADGYKTYIDSFLIDTANIELSIILNEIIISPYGLKTQQLNGNADVLFSWNNNFDYTENFESGYLSNNWQIQQFCQDTTANTPGYFTINDYSSTFFEPFGNYHAGLWWSFDEQNEWLITPEFACLDDMFLSFWSVCYEGSNNGDHYYVKVSADNGNTWTELWDASELNGNFMNYYEYPYQVDLSSFAGDNIQIAFNAVGQNGLWNIWFLDNILIETSNVSTSVVFDDFSSQNVANEQYNDNKSSFVSRENNWISASPKTKVIKYFGVLLDGVDQGLSITDSVFVFQNLESGEYTAGVYAVFQTGNSDTVYTKFVVNDYYDVTFEVYSSSSMNPVFDANINLYDQDSLYVANTDSAGMVSIISLPEAFYLYSVSDNNYVSIENIEFYLNSDTTIIILLDTIINISEFSNEIIIFPNPTSSLIKIQSVKLCDNQTVIKSIIITDISGHIVEQINEPITVQYLDLTHYLNGVYVIEIETENKKITKKIIKN